MNGGIQYTKIYIVTCMPKISSNSSSSLPSDWAALRQHAGAAVRMLKLLANEDRLMLLCQLAEQACTVAELEQRTGIGQPTLSQQLGVLRRQGLVSTEREGKFIRYQLADTRAVQLMGTIHQIFCPNPQA